jgi:hypothetical protein
MNNYKHKSTLISVEFVFFRLEWPLVAPRIAYDHLVPKFLCRIWSSDLGYALFISLSPVIGAQIHTALTTSESCKWIPSLSLDCPFGK